MTLREFREVTKDMDESLELNFINEGHYHDFDDIYIEQFYDGSKVICLERE